MLTITKAAGERLVRMLHDAPKHVVVRIVFSLRGLRFQYSAVCHGDAIFRHRGRAVLVLDRHLSDALRDKTLKIRHTNEGQFLDLL